MTDVTEVYRPARDPGHKPDILKHIYVEAGSNEDWKALCELHYKGHNVAAGTRYMRAVYDDGCDRILVGVMAFGMPRPLDSGRNEVFPRLKPNVNGIDNRAINQQRMAWINQNITWNNRTVLDTMFRGCGLAYRFKNLAYRMVQNRGKNFRYVESRSSMSRFNPFSLKAGMHFVKPKAAAALQTGIQFFSSILAAPGYDYVAIMEELAAMPEFQREYTLRKIREFYYKNSAQEKSGDKMHIGMSRVNAMETSYLIKQTQQIVFGATIYAIFVNPDWGRQHELPRRIPVLAFDLQGPNQPLRTDLLHTLDNFARINQEDYF
ncbi:hypothetical protein [Chromobacterium phragmitis]|uniref:Uncharacterized protein n=1 Tax=Chromobacterium phragmitis TaxID=2202141 RepID=A0ABV0J0K9_9NEIS